MDTEPAEMHFGLMTPIVGSTCRVFVREGKRMVSTRVVPTVKQ